MSVQVHAHAGIESPFHPGEREVQVRAGVRDEAEKRGQRMLTADLNNQQREFFQQLPFLLSAHVDTNGQPWASLLTGVPGFVEIEEDNRCTLHREGISNPTGISVAIGSSLGLLGIELATRRRNRLNSTVVAAGADQWRLSIHQGYGNCPKYISERPWPDALFTGEYTLCEQQGLSENALALASQTDTFFIATSSGPEAPDGQTQATAWGADVSHRGGEPGFLQRVNGQLMFEDFPGNNMFNTLGNITRYPPCGILILDFTTGDIVQLCALAEIIHSSTGRGIFLDITSTRHWTATGNRSQEQP